MHRSSPAVSVRLARLLLLAFLACAVPSSLESQTFKNPRHIVTASDPTSIHVADLNGDGLPDILYGTNSNQSTLHILLGQSGGRYISAPDITLPQYVSTNCQPVDTNGDGKVDLVCALNNANVAGGLVTFLGNGDGTFKPPFSAVSFPVASNYFALTPYPAFDLNSDGKPDFLVYDALNQRTFVILGVGNGTFTLTPQSNIGNGSPLVADLNGDGKPDLFFANGPSVALGNGDGTFKPMSSIGTYNGCLLKDMDGDGHLDAVCGDTVTNSLPNAGDIVGATELQVFHGNSDGSFNTTPIATVTYGDRTNQYAGMGAFLSPLVVTDINHDGIPDVLAYSNDGLGVILGRPGLTFAAPVHYPIGTMDSFDGPPPVFADLNNDGSLDVIAAGSNGLYITYGKPDGTFDSASVIESGQVVVYATVADFNGDGFPDIATPSDTTIQLSFGKGDGTFARPVAIPFQIAGHGSQYADTILHGDFNGDKRMDILANQGGTLYLLLGNGDGTFRAPMTASGIFSTPTNYPALAVFDINHDGRDDLLASGINTSGISQIVVSLSNGDGSFTAVSSVVPNDSQNGNSFPALADFDGDGQLDAVIGSQKNAYILLGHKDGTFTANGVSLPIPQAFGRSAFGASAVVTGDFDGDGKQDVALLALYAQNGYTANSGSTGAFVYYGNGDGTFTAPVTVGLFNRAYNGMVVSDLNQDGRADLVFKTSGTNGGGQSVGVVHALANRSFDTETNYVAGSGLSTLDAVDLNRDGFPDLIFANGDPNLRSNAVTLLLSQPAASIPTATGSLIIAPEPSIIALPVTLTATLSPPTGVTATLAGTITFSIDGIAVGTAPLSSNTATITTSTPLAIGTHQVTATWPGDTTYPAITLTTPHLVVGVPVTLNLASSASTASVGQQITLTSSVVNVAGVPAGSPAPTGTITLTDNGTLFATSTITPSGVILPNSLLLATAGTHTIVATYSGDASHPSATSTAIVQVTALPTTVTLASSANPAPYGLAITFTATVTANPALLLSGIYISSTVTFAGLPGGPISVPVTLSASGSSAGVAVGIATYTIATLPPGSYPITASFSGNNSTTASVSTSLTQVIRQAISSTALSVTPNPAFTGQTVTFAVTVSSPAGAPTGTVLLFDGGLPLATITLNPGSSTSTGGSAQAFFATALLGVGTHTLSARYSGDTSNLVSFSPNVSETILLSTFTLSLSPATLSLQTGHHATLTLTATSIGGFNDTLRLSTGNLPVYTTLTFTPATLQLPANGTATSTLYVDTDFVLGFASNQDPHIAAPKAGPQKLHPGLALALGTLSLTPLTLLLPLALRRNRMRLPTLLAAMVAFALLYSATGCSGRQPPSTVPGTYNIQITATPTFSQIPITLTLPLTITP